MVSGDRRRRARPPSISDWASASERASVKPWRSSAVNSDWISVVLYWSIENSPTKNSTRGNIMMAMMRVLRRLRRKRSLTSGLPMAPRPRTRLIRDLIPSITLAPPKWVSHSRAMRPM